MNHLRTDNTLCIVVDIQEKLTPLLSGHEAMVADTCKMIEGLKALDIPLLLTEQYPKGLGATIPAIHALLADVPVIEKTRFSAFLPEVQQQLEAKKIRNVILLGTEAHICMLQTLLDLRAEDYAVYVPFECLASRLEANKANALEQMQAAGAVVSNIESILFQLMQDAKHPAFKTISKLIQ